MLLAVGAWAAPPRLPAPLPGVVANDNSLPAGTLRHDTLTLALDVVRARWKPESPTDSGIVVAAFAEPGKPPRIPAPLIRVPAGTTIVLTLRNALPDSALRLYGLARHPAAQNDTVQLAPGAVRTLRFEAGAPGTYLYWAWEGAHNPQKDVERESAAGAFVVDPPGGSPPDRIFVINIWGNLRDSASYANALAINGRSWPWTERIAAAVGDTLRWRWVNASVRNHPMHLHGFYFQLDSRGSGLRDSVIAPASRPALVTWDVRPFETFAMQWVPERPGNWLYHCHIGFHVLPGAATLDPADTTAHQRMSDNPARHMAGLILGISVATPAGWRDAPRGDVQQLRLLVQEGARRSRAPRALGYVLQSGAAPAGDSVRVPGPLLLLTRGRPADITVVNRLNEPTAIHWHGIELESYSDGVAGWSGAVQRLAPAVQPGDSFVAHLTLPRAGTFMYHTHMNDLEQLTSGLYGPIVVLEPGTRFDPSRDHVFIGGWDGQQDPPHLLINGDSLPQPPLQLAAGVPHRFRFINIGPAGGYWPTLRQDTTVLRWKHVAKDGADLPPAQALPKPARFRIQVGETWDFQWTPLPGEYTLSLGDRDKPEIVQRIVVRP